MGRTRNRSRRERRKKTREETNPKEIYFHPVRVTYIIPDMNKAKAIQINGKMTPQYENILSPDAVDFIVSLQREFNERRETLLLERVKRQEKLDKGDFPNFLESTKSIREGDWKITSTPDDLKDRRVEITGPPDRKMVINALNSGASVFMADLEDSHSPTWEGTLEGQINLMDAVRKTISFTSPEGKKYALNEKTAVLFVRPRGWHLVEKHFQVDGKPISGSLFDFGLFFFHNAKEQLKRGTGPYFYLPKLENHLEARLWNDVFLKAQTLLEIPKATIKSTVLIETILAAFEMDEILYELKDHIVGLNCGRWDYIFSFIKKFRNHPDFLLPDRSLVTMNQHFLKSYYELLIRTCHRRQAHAMGGMAAQIPIKNDEEANKQAMERVRADKLREVSAGHDGTWVAHPGLVAIAREVFDKAMPSPNQLTKLRTDVQVTAKDLITVPEGQITEAGFRNNISVGVQYLESWLGGNGCVPLFNLMEDAATAEIARAQLWQWIRHPKGILNDGRRITASLFRTTLKEELEKIRLSFGEEKFSKRNFGLAEKLFDRITTSDTFTEFLTLSAYEQIT